MPAKNLFIIYIHCIDILRLKKNPQDLLISRKNFIEVLIIYFAISYITAMIFLAVEQALPFALLDLTLLLGFSYGCLLICGYVTRWRQTVTALAGTGTMLGLIAVPLLVITNQFKEVPILSAVSSGFLTAVLIWNIIVNGHIFRHAFSILLIGGITIAVMYYLLMNALVVLLMPEQFSP